MSHGQEDLEEGVSFPVTFPKLSCDNPDECCGDNGSKDPDCKANITFYWLVWWEQTC